MRKIIILSLLVGFTSCLKKEIPIKKPLANAAVSQIEMGSNYGNQLFFNVETNSIVKINNREVWDIGFESLTEGNHILLNSSKLMAVAKTNQTSLESVTSINGLEFKFDAPNGNFDSTAFNGEWDTTFVYVIDRGVSLSGVPLGYVKFKLLEVSNDQYKFQWSNLSNNQIKTNLVIKSETLNVVCFSFENDGDVVEIEPPSFNWQLCFTTYTHVFHDGTPYLVCGVLSNRNQVQVAAIDSPFEQIAHSNAISINFDANTNNIGYDWKIYDFDQSMYTIDVLKNYIIKTQNARFYKLRFIDFYTVSGVKGAPKFELIELIP